MSENLKTYYDTKRLQAEPMTRGAYNELRGWDLPSDEDGSEEGYLVVYPDSKNNVEGYEGYVSWSPTPQFENAYRENGRMNFGHALEALKAGEKVRRAHWKNVRHIYLVAGSQFNVNRAPLLGLYQEGTPVDYKPHIDAILPAPEGDFDTVHSCVWTASMGDVLAEDWEIVAEVAATGNQEERAAA